MNFPDDFINQVICGDCMQVMREMPDKCVDLVLTDPPYGIGRDKGFGGFGGFGRPIARRKYQDEWDKKRPDKQHFDEILRIAKIGAIFGGNFFPDILPLGGHWLVWDKMNTMPSFGDCELIWTNVPRTSVKIYRYEYNGLLGKEATRFHPTQKPLKLIKQMLLDYSKPNELIFDCYLGSGTTLVAAKELGRRFIGIEISPEYCAIANDRLRQTVVLPFKEPEQLKQEQELFKENGT